MNESFKTDPSLATSARAANESGSYLCASNVTPTAVRFIVSVFLCVLCFCRMSSTQMTCSHFRKNRPKKRQKPAGCRSRIISKNRPVPIFGWSTGASLVKTSTEEGMMDSLTLRSSLYPRAKLTSEAKPEHRAKCGNGCGSNMSTERERETLREGWWFKKVEHLH